MFENIVLGIIQGIAEWLPVSSEGLLILVKTNFFYQEGDYLGSLIKIALFLHFGTFLSALIYFRQDVVKLVAGLFKFKSQPKETQILISYLIIATLISGVIGIVLIKTLSKLSLQFDTPGKIITLLVGCLLLVTAYLELKAKRSGYREIKDITIKDGIILGITQGFAALPGFSRSGFTVSALLLRKFDKTHALKLSFLMSLPIVLAGNLILHANILEWSKETFLGLVFSFVFGLATIHMLIKLAEKINFGYFMVFFGLLTILSVFV